MAEARSEEEEENMRRNAGERVLRRQSNSAEGHPDRRKPENRLSQGPLWSLKAALRRTTNRPTSLSEAPRDSFRDGGRRGSSARRPEITILSVEPLPTTSWLPGAFPPPPPPAAQIWGPTIPPSVQPPPSYDEVIREKTQEQGVHTSSPSPPLTHPAFRSTISTQTDTGSSPRSQESLAGRAKPPRPPLPCAVSQDDAGSPLTPTSEGGRQLPAFDEAAPSTTSHINEVGHPRPRPRSRRSVPSVSNEVKVQTLVKLREDGLATLAARANADISKKEVIQGKYFQELLEAFSADDWGFPEGAGDDSGLSQSEEEEDMATLKARIQAFEPQEQQGGHNDEKVGKKKPEPRPRPRLQRQPAKVLPPTIAPKPKSLSQVPRELNTLTTEAALEEFNAQPVPESLPPSPAPIPTPRLPSTKPPPSANETPSTDKSPSRPPVAPRTIASPNDRAPVGGNVTPTRPLRPSKHIKREAQTTSTMQLTDTTTEPTLVLSTAPALGKAPPLAPTKFESISQPSLPSRPSSVRSLPVRPSSIKSVPARPPPPTSVSCVIQPPQMPSNQAQCQRASKRGPPLPPRPHPGHPVFTSYMTATHSQDTDDKHESKVLHCQTGMSHKQDVLIVLDDPSQPQCFMDLHVVPPPSKPSLEVVKQSELQTIQTHPEPPPTSGPRCVALFNFEGMQDDELTFSQGDVIGLLELIGTEWGRGHLAGRVGLFPLSFTQITQPLPPEGTEKASLIMREVVIGSPAAPQSLKDAQVEEWAVALFDFPAQTAEDLSFQKGAIIQVTEYIDSKWRRGRLDGMEGLYPAAFTKACQTPPVSGRGMATVLFGFTAKTEDELTVKAGDIITLVEPVDEQWIVGVVGSQRGMVPKNYVCLL
ncbi:uncharacterized protein [Nerophis lumbriciformis]|uniref:uncharacterized protein isoform X1 n=1 Tax=Nerophis lumbriciformis TaxID=546530 RepID=UPI003BAC2A29